MKCKYLELIGVFKDGELNKSKQQEVSKHLLECSQCQQELRDLQKLNELLSSFKDKAVPQYLVDDILNKFPIDRQLNLRNVINFPIAAMLVVSFISGIYLSNLAFKPAEESYTEFGQESFYNYFEGVDDEV